MRETESGSERLSLIMGDTMEAPRAKAPKRLLLAFFCAMLALGNCGGPLLTRVYFLRGGTLVWLCSGLQTSGWPIIFLPLAIAYSRRRSAEGPSARLVLMDPFLFLASAVIGVLTGLDNYLYASGGERLPVSTSTLLAATQLAFTAGFAFLLVRQLFTSYSINSVFLLTVGAGMLAMNTSSDLPEGETNWEYYEGFFMMLASAALCGFIMPLVELTYKKAKQAITYSLVLEIQLVMCFFSTLFCTIGMLVGKDFQEIPTEAKNYELGEALYYVVLAGNVIVWQLYILGFIGVIFCSSSLFAGIVIAVLLPITEILGVICFQEQFQAEKAVALILSLWGFASYLYGEFKAAKKDKKQPQQQEAEAHQQGLP